MFLWCCFIWYVCNDHRLFDETTVRILVLFIYLEELCSIWRKKSGEMKSITCCFFHYLADIGFVLITFLQQNNEGAWLLDYILSFVWVWSVESKILQFKRGQVAQFHFQRSLAVQFSLIFIEMITEISLFNF